MSDEAITEPDSKSPKRTYPEIDAVMDAVTEVGAASARFALGALQREAADDADRAAAVRVEGNTWLMFSGRGDWERMQPHLSSLLYPADLEYLRLRLVTPNIAMRARYLHATAMLTKRKDDGRAAAEAHLDAISLLRAQPTENNAEAFHGLIRLFPMAALLSKRYGVGDRYKTEVIGFLTDPRPHFAAAKARVFIDAVSDKKIFGRAELEQLRDVALTLPETLSGNDQELISQVARASERLLVRLGEPPTAALRAEAAALEQKIIYNSHPMNVEIIGSRLVHLYERLKDPKARQTIIEKMRAARATQEYQTIGGPVDGWSEEVERIRGIAASMLQGRGPIGMLIYFAANRGLLPHVEDVQAQVDRLEADGIGVYRKLATVIVSSGERIIGSEGNAFDEQYGYYWQILSVARFSVMFSDLVAAGDVTIEHIETMLAESWIARDEAIPYGGDEMMPNDLVPLLLAPLRLYIAVETGELSRNALIPALDSLVLRIEAVLRKLARLLREPDSKTDADGLTDYHGLKKLLANDVITAKLGTDLTAFIRYTLIREPEGLRDRIGHAILHLGQYRSLDLDAVVLLLLRLAALDVPSDSEAAEVDEPSKA